MPELLLHFWETHTVPPSPNLFQRLCAPSSDCQRAELELGLSGGLGGSCAERRGLQGAAGAAGGQFLGTGGHLGGHVSQGALTHLGHQGPWK